MVISTGEETGVIFGVGLGGSVEKLHWLPEAHTDFLMAVIGEEFGLVGVVVVIGLFSVSEILLMLESTSSGQKMVRASGRA